MKCLPFPALLFYYLYRISFLSFFIIIFSSSTFFYVCANKGCSIPFRYARYIEVVFLDFSNNCNISLICAFLAVFLKWVVNLIPKDNYLTKAETSLEYINNYLSLFAFSIRSLILYNKEARRLIL